MSEPCSHENWDLDFCSQCHAYVEDVVNAQQAEIRTLRAKAAVGWELVRRLESVLGGGLSIDMSDLNLAELEAQILSAFEDELASAALQQGGEG